MSGMMPGSLRMLGDDFKRGDHLSAQTLNLILNALQRQIIGDGVNIRVRTFGNRIVIESIEKEKFPVPVNDTTIVQFVCDVTCDPDTQELVVTKKWLKIKGNVEILDEKPADVWSVEQNKWIQNPDIVDCGDPVEPDQPPPPANPWDDPTYDPYEGRSEGGG